jgi:WD40 repeat protein
MRIDPNLGRKENAMRRLLVLSVMIWITGMFIIQAGCAASTEPPQEPILRLETGVHTAIIKKIGVDAANRWLVIASDDKTVLLWELPSGRLVRVIRPPLGQGNEGKFFTAAISPSGRQIACGGWTGWDSPPRMRGTSPDPWSVRREGCTGM